MRAGGSSQIDTTAGSLASQQSVHSNWSISPSSAVARRRVFTANGQSLPRVRSGRHQSQDSTLSSSSSSILCCCRHRSNGSLGSPGARSNDDAFSTNTKYTWAPMDRRNGGGGAGAYCGKAKTCCIARAARHQRSMRCVLSFWFMILTGLCLFLVIFAMRRVHDRPLHLALLQQLLSKQSASQQHVINSIQQTHRSLDNLRVSENLSPDILNEFLGNLSSCAAYGLQSTVQGYRQDSCRHLFGDCAFYPTERSSPHFNASSEADVETVINQLGRLSPGLLAAPTSILGSIIRLPLEAGAAQHMSVAWHAPDATNGTASSATALAFQSLHCSNTRDADDVRMLRGADAITSVRFGPNITATERDGGGINADPIGIIMAALLETSAVDWTSGPDAGVWPERIAARTDNDTCAVLGRTYVDGRIAEARSRLGGAGESVGFDASTRWNRALYLLWQFDSQCTSGYAPGSRALLEGNVTVYAVTGVSFATALVGGDAVVVGRGVLSVTATTALDSARRFSKLGAALESAAFAAWRQCQQLSPHGYSSIKVFDERGGQPSFTRMAFGDPSLDSMQDAFSSFAASFDSPDVRHIRKDLQRLYLSHQSSQLVLGSVAWGETPTDGSAPPYKQLVSVMAGTRTLYDNLDAHGTGELDAFFAVNPVTTALLTHGSRGDTSSSVSSGVLTAIGVSPVHMGGALRPPVHTDEVLDAIWPTVLAERAAATARNITLAVPTEYMDRQCSQQLWRLDTHHTCAARTISSGEAAKDWLHDGRINVRIVEDAGAPAQDLFWVWTQPEQASNDVGELLQFTGLEPSRYLEDTVLIGAINFYLLALVLAFTCLSAWVALSFAAKVTSKRTLEAAKKALRMRTRRALDSRNSAHNQSYNVFQRSMKRISDASASLFRRGASTIRGGGVHRDRGPRTSNASVIPAWDATPGGDTVEVGGKYMVSGTGMKDSDNSPMSQLERQLSKANVRRTMSKAWSGVGSPLSNGTALMFQDSPLMAAVNVLIALSETLDSEDSEQIRNIVEGLLQSPDGLYTQAPGISGTPLANSRSTRGQGGEGSESQATSNAQVDTGILELVTMNGLNRAVTALGTQYNMEGVQKLNRAGSALPLHRVGEDGRADPLALNTSQTLGHRRQQLTTVSFRGLSSMGGKSYSRHLTTALTSPSGVEEGRGRSGSVVLSPVRASPSHMQSIRSSEGLGDEDVQPYRDMDTDEELAEEEDELLRTQDKLSSAQDTMALPLRASDGQAEANSEEDGNSDDLDDDSEPGALVTAIRAATKSTGRMREVTPSVNGVHGGKIGYSVTPQRSGSPPLSKAHSAVASPSRASRPRLRSSTSSHTHTPLASQKSAAGALPGGRHRARRASISLLVDMTAAPLLIQSAPSMHHLLPQSMVTAQRIERIRSEILVWEFDTIDFAARNPEPLVTMTLACLDIFNLLPELDGRYRQKDTGDGTLPPPPKAASPTGEASTWMGDEQRTLAMGDDLSSESMTRLLNFLRAIQSGYCDVPYHNVQHATDSVHGVFYICARSSLMRGMTSNELIALLLSAAIHDFKHPGVNNNFLMASSDGLAIRYNDRSVLENFHLASAFEIMRDEDCNALHLMSPEAQRTIRELMISIVLATDLAHSFDIIGKFRFQLQGSQARRQAGVTRASTKTEATTAGPTGSPSHGHSVSPGSYDLTQKAARLLALQMAMKCADVSSGAKPFEIHCKWTVRICEEFYRQGDAEKDLGLPAAQFMDRDKVNLPRSQHGFLHFVVLPIYDAWVSAFPVTSKYLTYLEANKARWKGMDDGLETMPGWLVPAPRPPADALSLVAHSLNESPPTEDFGEESFVDHALSIAYSGPLSPDAPSTGHKSSKSGSVHHDRIFRSASSAVDGKSIRGRSRGPSDATSNGIIIPRTDSDGSLIE